MAAAISCMRALPAGSLRIANIENTPYKTAITPAPIASHSHVVAPMQNSCRKSASYDLKEPAALGGPPFEGAHYNNVSCPGQPEILDDSVGQRRQARGCS